MLPQRGLKYVRALRSRLTRQRSQAGFGGNVASVSKPWNHHSTRMTDRVPRVHTSTRARLQMSHDMNMCRGCRILRDQLSAAQCSRLETKLGYLPDHLRHLTCAMLSLAHPWHAKKRRFVREPVSVAALRLWLWTYVCDKRNPMNRSW